MKLVLATFGLLCGLTLLAPTPAAALSTPHQYMGCGTGIAAFLGLKPWHACLQKDSNGVPQITQLNDIWLIVLPLIEDALKIAGYVAAGFVIWGGVKYLKSQGDPGEITQARQIIHNALFGLVLAMISVAIVNLIAGAF